MMNEKVEVQIGNRHLVVEMPEFFPAEIDSLAKMVTERMNDLQTHNSTVADSSKIALLVALSFAADLEKERRAHGAPRRSGISGRISELSASEDAGEHFRATLLQENAAPIRLLVPSKMINLFCKAFVGAYRVNLTGRTVPGGEQTSFSVDEIAHV